MDESNEMMLENEAEIETEALDPTPEQEEKIDEVLALRKELEELRALLQKKDMEQKAETRISRELADFEEYFPEVELESIPDEVWQRVKSGASLSAEYSLLCRRRELEKRRISDFNENNRKMSAGAAGRGESEKYYSPSEVKRMSPAQVKTHYDEIIESMRHWN